MKKFKEGLPGLMPVCMVGALALGSTHFPALSRSGIGPLTVAILIGILLGNLLPARLHDRYRAGLKFSQSRLLRAGVALYGLNLSIQQIVEIGSHGVLVDLSIVLSTLCLGFLLGTRLFGMDRDSALLTAAGSAICGAAAIVATAPLLGMDEEKSADATTAAVSSVVIFGSLAMMIYPAIYALSGMNQAAFGVYVGSTVHEVAQVVAIGNMIGGDVAHPAVIVKMLRVLMLIPFLLFLSVSSNVAKGGGKVRIPWFAIVFLMLASLNSLNVLPEALGVALRHAGLMLLTAAMAALGMDTHLARFRQAGLKAVGLGAGLFIHLSVAGGLINYLLRAA